MILHKGMMVTVDGILGTVVDARGLLVAVRFGEHARPEKWSRSRVIPLLLKLMRPPLHYNCRCIITPLGFYPEVCVDFHHKLHANEKEAGK